MPRVDCELIRLARARHKRDLCDGPKRGLWFDHEAAERVRLFFSTFLRHSKGEWAGQTFDLQNWQYNDLIAPVFGWKRLPPGMTARRAKAMPISERVAAGIVRRYTTAYTEVARKNGKSTILAGVGLYLEIADYEPGAEIYTAATKRDQAKIIHEEARRMARASRGLAPYLKVQRDEILAPCCNSRFLPLGADMNTLDGLNPHGGLIDEYHAHKTSDVRDVIKSGMGARRQPLEWIITTAGFNLASPCFAEREYAEGILRGTIVDDSFFAAIYTLDTGDDYRDKKNWHKPNPGLDVTVKRDYLDQQVRKARNSPVSRPSILTKHFNIWLRTADGFFDMAAWDACGAGVDDPVKWRARTLEKLKGARCWGGLDLGSVSDFTAFALVFQDGDGYYVLPWFWLPEETADGREDILRKMYRGWVDRGFISYTPGNVTDYGYMRQEIGLIGQQFMVQEIAVDRLFQGAGVCTDLHNDGFNVVAFGQGFFSMAGPSKHIEELVLNGKLQHGNNPVLRWMASNCGIKTDPAGNVKPVKPERKNPLKIDGIVASIMALGRAMVAPGESVYNTMGADDNGTESEPNEAGTEEIGEADL